jgi:hypothetical protein
MVGRALRIAGIAFLAFVVAVVLLVVLVLEPPKKAIDAANRVAADQIVAALAAYQKANDQYPPDLNRLSPAYLAKVPQEQRARGTPDDFSYEMQDSGKAFVLRYGEAPLGPFPSDSMLEFDSRVRLWQTKYF